MGTRPITMRAFAKINLSLRVLDARADGHHEVRTVLQTLALHDTLTFRPSNGPIAIECRDPACPTDRTNLVWRAAERVWQAAGRGGVPRGVRVRIEKRIPIQSGLGGGSSDAAAAICALTRLWNVDLTTREKQAVAASLGADVPFFLIGGTALGLGRGDVIVPLADVVTAWVTVVVPTFGVSTKDAYGWWDQAEGKRQKAEGKRQKAKGRSNFPTAQLINDLQRPVAVHHPEIGRIARALRGAGAAYAAMSGSGSAVFALFASQTAARAAAGMLRSSSRRIIVTRTLNRQRHDVMTKPH